MKKLLLSLLLAPSFLFAGSYYGWDSNGTYFNGYSNGNSSYGYDSNGNYYNFYRSGNSTYGWDSNGNYYNYYYYYGR
jgi:hypothetical protein